MNSFSRQVIGAVTPEMVDDLLANSFFLQAEIIELAAEMGWVIEPIKVASQEEFRYALPLFEELADSYVAQPSANIVNAAKRVATSVRRNPVSGKTYVIAKLWME